MGQENLNRHLTEGDMSESCSVVSDSLWPHGLYNSWTSPCQNTGVGSLSLLQGIFSTQDSNPGLLHCRILDQLSHKRSPRILGWVAYMDGKWARWRDALHQMLSVKCKLSNSEMPLHIYQNDQNPEHWHHMLASAGSNRKSHSLLVGMQTGTATVETVWF